MARPKKSEAVAENLDLKKEVSSNKWSRKRRIEFIDFRLYLDGKINRGDLVSFFGISIPQASLDMAYYRNLVANAKPPRENLVYDQHQKVYLRSDDFKPIFPEVCDSNVFFNDLLAYAQHDLSQSRNFFGFIPDVGTSQLIPPKRVISEIILRNIIDGIRGHMAMHVVYASVSSGKNEDILISPHSFAYAGNRWHVRAYSFDRHEFRDYVLTRIISADVPRINAPSDRFPDPMSNGFREVGTEGKDDLDWNEVVTLKLKANPDLPEVSRRAIEMDYGISENSYIEHKVRKALLFYTMQDLRLSKEYDSLPAVVKQLVLVNKSEISTILDELGKK